MKKEIQEMPKVILHLHLDGSLRPEGVLQEKTNLIKQINDYRERTQQRINC